MNHYIPTPEGGYLCQQVPEPPPPAPAPAPQPAAAGPDTGDLLMAALLVLLLLDGSEGDAETAALAAILYLTMRPDP